MLNKRLFDFLVCIFLMGLLSVPFFIIFLVVKFTSEGPAIYWSTRVGKNNEHFEMPKFRTMQIGTPEVATHLLSKPTNYLTKIGYFLRKTSLDEIPQLWSVLKGDMSIVGPRPALFNQYDLIDLRTLKRIHQLTPGITGWAQVNGRDNLSNAKKVFFDEEYLKKKSLFFDLKILCLTIIKIIQKDGVRH